MESDYIVRQSEWKPIFVQQLQSKISDISTTTCTLANWTHIDIRHTGEKVSVCQESWLLYQIASPVICDVL